jgi:hypothetical protein
MSAYYLLYEKFKERGWNEETKLQLCMEFIDKMDFFNEFKEFLQRVLEDEYWASLEPFEKGERIRSFHGDGESRFDPSTIHLAHGKSYDEEEIK